MNISEFYIEITISIIQPINLIDLFDIYLIRQVTSGTIQLRGRWQTSGVSAKRVIYFEDPDKSNKLGKSKVQMQ